jgi:DNA-binding transcriptional regulator YdaS (Cro superfamily)
MTPREALQKAIAVLGSQTALADAAGTDVETGHVYYWLNKAPEVPARYCPGIERATRLKGDTVFCEQLCPSTDWAAVRAEQGPTAAPLPVKAPLAPGGRVADERAAAAEERRQTERRMAADKPEWGPPPAFGDRRQEDRRGSERGGR